MIGRHVCLMITAAVLLGLAGVATGAKEGAEFNELTNNESTKGETEAKWGGLTVQIRWSPDPESELKNARGAVVYLKTLPDQQRKTDSHGVVKIKDPPAGDAKLIVLVGVIPACELPVKITGAPQAIVVDVTPAGCAIAKP